MPFHLTQLTISSKAVLFAALFQLFFVIAMAQSCNIVYHTDANPNNGPYAYDVEKCYLIPPGFIRSVGIQGGTPGQGYIEIYTSNDCNEQNYISKGPSPLSLGNLPGTKIGSIKVTSCQ